MGLLILLFASDAFAFCPSHNRWPSFVSRRNERRAPRVYSMNLFERFSRVAKANLNQLVSNLEDPEKVMTQAVEDLNKDLVKVRQSYAEVMATQENGKAEGG